MAFSSVLVKALWKFTLSVWGSQNEKVNGMNNKYSSRNIRGIQQCIRDIYDIYEKFKDRISSEDQWLFREEEQIRCEQSVPQMIGWLERVLLCVIDLHDADDVVIRSKRLLCKMSISSIFD